jgi:hypothetical protein
MTTTVLMTETRGAGADGVYEKGSQYSVSDELAGFLIGKNFATRVGVEPEMFAPAEIAAHAAEHAAMNSEVTASRSLTKADSGQVLKCTHATVAIVLTIESDATSGWSANEAVAAYQGGAAAVSFAAGSGVTLRGTAPTAAQYSTQAVHRVGANEWAYL